MTGGGTLTSDGATIENSDIICSAAGNRGDVDIAGVMVYQSMSGDANEGTNGGTVSLQASSQTA